MKSWTETRRREFETKRERDNDQISGDKMNDGDKHGPIMFENSLRGSTSNPILMGTSFWINCGVS